MLSGTKARHHSSKLESFGPTRTRRSAVCSPQAARPSTIHACQTVQILTNSNLWSGNARQHIHAGRTGHGGCVPASARGWRCRSRRPAASPMSLPAGRGQSRGRRAGCRPGTLGSQTSQRAACVETRHTESSACQAVHEWPTGLRLSFDVSRVLTDRPSGLFRKPTENSIECCPDKQPQLQQLQGSE